MPCDERASLEKEHNDANAAFDALRKSVFDAIDAGEREFTTLNVAVSHAWERVSRARSALHQHLRKHDCRNPKK